MPPQTTSQSSARQDRPGSAGRAGASVPSAATPSGSSGAAAPAASPTSTASAKASASAASSASASTALTARPARSRLTDAVATALRPLRWLLQTITPIGWGCLVLLVACGLTGAVMGWQEAWSAAIVVGIVVVSAWLWLIPRGGYSVNHNLLEPRVTVGDHALIRLTVTNPRPRPLLPSRMEMPVGPGSAVFVVPTLTPRAVHERGFVLPTQRRGIVTVGPVLAVQRDPVGLLQHERSLTTPQHIHIHPRTLRLGTVLHGVLRDIEGAVTQDLSSSDVAFHALREYVPGDDRRNVHWRTPARTGRLMVRQFAESRRAHLLIVFDDDARSWHHHREYELGVSVAASIGAAVIRERRDLSFTSQLGPVPTSSPNAFLDGLTKIEPNAGVERLGDLARIATDREPQASVVAVVTGSRPEASELHRAHAALPVNARSFALRIHEAERVSRALVGGFPIVTIPSLDSLPLALRKVVS